MTKKCYLILSFPLILLISADLEAAIISRHLQSILQTAGEQDELPVIIQLSDQTDIHQIRERSRRLRRARIIKALKSRAELKQAPIKELLEKRRAGRVRFLWLINGIAVTARADTIRELANYPGISSIRWDAPVYAPEVSYGAATPTEWNLEAIQATELWALGFTGQGIVVATMDTGVDAQHPDLQNKWRGGTNSWYDPHGQHSVPYDISSGHATQVMGLIVGGDAGGTAIGLAPDAQWIAVKIFNDSGQSSLSAIHQGFQWLLDPDDNPETDDAPDVVNNSWGLIDTVNQCSSEFQPDIQALKEAGIAVVFAAGNFGPNPSTSVSPANNPEAFSVGGVDQSMSADYSHSRGPSACDGGIYPEAVAPGVSVKTTDLSIPGLPLPMYAYVSDSSFAAPHVSGAMALLLSAFPSVILPELESALRDSAHDLGVVGPDNDYGYGLINVLAAYNILGSGAVVVKGDIDNNGITDLEDSILALQVISGQKPAGIRPDYATSGVDVNGDNRIGPAEVIFILQKLATLR